MDQPDSKWQPDDDTPLVRISLDEALGTADEQNPDPTSGVPWIGHAARVMRDYGDAYFMKITGIIDLAVSSADDSVVMIRVGESYAPLGRDEINRLLSALSFVNDNVLTR